MPKPEGAAWRAGGRDHRLPHGTGSAYGIEATQLRTQRIPHTPTVTLPANGASLSVTSVPSPGGLAIVVQLQAPTVSTSSTGFGTAAGSITSTASTNGHTVLSSLGLIPLLARL